MPNFGHSWVVIDGICYGRVHHYPHDGGECIVPSALREITALVTRLNYVSRWEPFPIREYRSISRPFCSTSTTSRSNALE
jgi:hypothetical protein